MIAEKHDPLALERLKLVTIIKVTEFNWWSHAPGDIQISIDCLALDGMAGVMNANIQESAKDGDYKKVAELATRYSLGSLHWITCRVFCFMEEGLHFYNAKTKAVNAEDAEKIGRFYFAKSHTDCEPQAQAKPIVVATS